LGENVINLCKPKVAQYVVNALGYFIFSKNHNQLQKVAQTAKNSRAWSPCFSQKLNDLDEKKVFEIFESKKKKKSVIFPLNASLVLLPLQLSTISKQLTILKSNI
jgi:hypothetical protein